MIGGGKIKWSFMEIWQCKAPPTVRVFLLLMLKNKLLTHDVMLRRGFRVDMQCQMCKNCPSESTLHLLFLCPYATSLWFFVASILGRRLMISDVAVQLIWRASKESQPTFDHTDWVLQFACTVWHIWKMRNKQIFNKEMIQPKMLAERIIQESNLWLRYG